LSHSPRVLIMDDSEIALEVARSRLEAGGFDTRGAQSLGEFAAIISTWCPEIVLTDVNMPGLSGPDLCRAIKSRFDTKRVHVVLFSDLPKDDLQRLTREAGSDGYLSKESRDFAGALRTFCEMVRDETVP
jgi:sigma-B regulation protein RsbU (phosphoserine phosphatase)